MRQVKLYIFFCLLLFLGLGCGHIKPKVSSLPNKAPPSLTDLKRKELVKVAKKNIGQERVKVSGKAFRADCSGTIRGIFYAANLRLGAIIRASLDNDVKMIYRYVKKYGQIKKDNPKAGDLIFFHNTYDRKKSGKMNSALTHIGIVEMVSGGTVHFIHHMGKTIIRSKMTLAKKNINVDPKTKQRLNHVLRRAQNGKRSFNAAQLFAGFGHL